MSEKNRKKLNKVYEMSAVVLALLLVIYELLPFSLSDDELTARLVDIAVTRLLGGLIFLLIVLRVRYRIFGSYEKKCLIGALLCFPALLVVVNNLPIIGLLSGDAYIVRYDLIPLFALESFAIGFYEEFAFRGFVFPYVMEKKGTSRKGIFVSILISGAVFALMHLINLFEGAGFGSVVLQIGYSFLIGAMCSVVLVKSRNIWICVALHSIYDFCGFLVPELGKGVIWDPVTVTVTVILAVATFIYMLYIFFKTDLSSAADIYAQ